MTFPIKKQHLKKVKSKFHNKSLKILKFLRNDTDLTKLIDNNEIISFDIFDTVIVRKVLEPADIFKIVEDLYIDRYGPLDIKFTDIRRKAEPEATKISGAQCIGLDEIYLHIQKVHQLTQGTIQRLKTLEIETELNFCVQNKYMYSFYKYCIDSGKKVIFTSDMYLPEDVIKKILHDNGYTQFHKLYLSSVIGKSKSKGTLYTHILNELSCNPANILHIGDYFYADIINSMKKNINSFYYKKPSEHAFEYTEFNALKKLYGDNLSIDESIYFATIINKVFTERNNDNDELPWYDFGYIYCGIIYFGFVRWLTDQLIEDKIEKAFFLARDGYMMHEVYKLINQGQDVPISEYMYASRRAINIPTIQHDIDEHSMKILCNLFPDLSVEDYLNRVHISADNHISKIKEVGLSSKIHKIQSTSDKQKLAKLFTLLVEDVCNISAFERENLVKYLEQINFMAGGKIAIVDIGWQGTMQNSFDKLMALLNKSIDLKGYYLGTFETAKPFVAKGLPMSGYICHFSEPKNNYDIISRGVHMLEFIFSAPHGSVINFTSINEKIQPVCEQPDFSTKNSDKITELQKGALDFITDFMATENDYQKMKIAPDSVLKPISRLLNYPTYKESVQFGNLTHSEYVGKTNYERYFARMADPLNMFLNPSKFKKAYCASLWKVGFRKRYLGKILPDKLFCYIKNIKNN